MGRPDDTVEKQDREPPEDPGSTLVEKAAGIVSGLLVAAMIAMVLYQAVTTGGDRHPDLTVAVETVRAQGGGHQAVFEIRNAGGATAAAVHVEGVLLDGDETVEAAEATIDYVPAHSEQRGGVIFRNDPARYALRLRVTGYRMP